MAGEGFAFYANSILKNNRSLLKKKGFFYLKSEYLKSAEKKSLNLKSATPEQLKKIRDEITERNKYIVIKTVAAIIISILLAAVFILGAVNFGQWMFEDAKYSVPKPLRSVSDG